MATPCNSVYIATSLDGFIADTQRKLDWLESVPNPDGDDLGYAAFTQRVDALVMGRNTFETILGFGIDWPYQQPVFVLSTKLQVVPPALTGRVQLLSGSPTEILSEIHRQGYFRLYLDGGQTVQQFLQADLVDELILTVFPLLLGGGVPLFGALPNALHWELRSCSVLLDQLVQKHYWRAKQGTP